MANLYAAFQEAAGTSEDGHMDSPGAGGIEFLLKSHGFETSLDKVQKEFDDMGWDENYSLSWKDFQRLAVNLGIDQAEETANGSEDNRAHELTQSGSGIIDTIAVRMKEQKFPYVHPDDLEDSQESSQAEANLEYIQKVETVEVQSYIDAERAKYAASNPGDENLPREVKDAQWIRQSYYPLMRDFFYTKALEKKNFSHRMSECGFVPLVAVASIGDVDKREMAAAAAKKMAESYIPTFDDKLWKAWKKAEAVLEFTDTPVKEVFASFLDENYFQILKECVDAEDAQCAEPKYPVSCNNATVEETEARKLLLNKLTKADLEAVEDKVRELWDETRLDSPTFMQKTLTQNPPKMFWEKTTIQSCPNCSTTAAPRLKSWHRDFPLTKVEPRKKSKNVALGHRS